jgi:hypothetical protein
MPDSHEVKARELLERAEQLGIRVEYDSGLVVARRSATADPYAVQIFRLTIEGLGKYIVAVRRLAMGRAQAARLSEFIGGQIFVPGPEIIVGTLKSIAQDGAFTVSYRTTIRDIERELTCSCRADGCLIAVGMSERVACSTDFRLVQHRRASDGLHYGDECPRCAEEYGVPQKASENIRGTTLELVNRAEKLGMVLRYDSGLVIAGPGAIGREQAETAEIVRLLGSRLVELHQVMAARARAARGADLVGQEVFIAGPDLGGWGTIVTAENNGMMNVSLERGSRGSLSADAKDLLIVLGDAEPASFPAAAKSERASVATRIRRAVTGNAV